MTLAPEESCVATTTRSRLAAALIAFGGRLFDARLAPTVPLVEFVGRLSVSALRAGLSSGMYYLNLSHSAATPSSRADGKRPLGAQTTRSEKFGTRLGYAGWKRPDEALARSGGQTRGVAKILSKAAGA